MKKLLLVLFVFACTGTFAQDSTAVYFDFDKAELTPQAKQILDQILARPKLYSAMIYGHTDQLGSNGYNEQLSVKRANAVKDYFVSKGIAAERIRLVEGFGKTKPVVDKLDAQSRKLNRRVVIITQYEVTARDSVITEEHPKQTPPVSIPATPERPKEPVRKPVKENLITEVTDTTTREGDNIILQNINFFGGRHAFLPQAYDALNELLYVMQTIPTLEIEIQGHICCQEGDSDGLDIETNEPFLSYNRARAVYQYLVDHGIDRKRMRYKGYGHKFPLIAVEQNESERTINRRVEIKILKK